MQQQLQGKSVLITGASSGFGAHFAELMAKHGAALVVMCARRLAKLEQLKQDLEREYKNTKFMCIMMDVSSVDSIRLAFTQFPLCTIVLNNAGVSTPKPLLEVTEEEYDGVMDVNAKGAFFVLQEAARQMQARQIGGTIVNISSILGMRVSKNLSTYSMSKSAVNQMTQAAALELSKYKIRVNSICPGYIRTKMNQAFFDTERGKQEISQKMLAKRLGNVEELDGAVLLFCNDQTSSFMTGSILAVDGGHLVGGL